MDGVSVTPIFLFSIPRCGSTLTQRILAAHPQIATVSEPWILLPLLYTMRDRGVRAEYGHSLLVNAVEDLGGHLPGGMTEYTAELRDLAMRLYRRLSPEDAVYFLDKTPRYHLIVDEVIHLFPDARFIFLWRNPLAVVASIVDTGLGGRWDPNRFRIDLFRGLAALVDAYRRNGERSVSVRYEDVIGGTDALRSIFDYLDLDFDPASLAKFGDVELPGRMGDRRGMSEYESLSSEPLDKWRSTLASPVRKRWCRRYLQWIGAERLETMGYDLETLLRELDALPARPYRAAIDAPRLVVSSLRERAKRMLLRSR